MSLIQPNILLFNQDSKNFLTTNISNDLETFEKIYDGYNSTAKKYQDDFNFDNFKHDNFAEFFIVNKLSILNLESNEFAKQYADWYYNLFLVLSTNPEKTNRIGGIFYGLEFANGLEIYNKLNLKEEEYTIEQIKHNYEKGIGFLINNTVLNVNIQPDDIKKLNNLASAIKMYWILWQKSPSNYNFCVNVEQN